jgi:hypothetical protein
MAPGNKLRHGELELADKHAPGGGHMKAGAVLASGERQR